VTREKEHPEVLPVSGDPKWSGACGGKLRRLLGTSPQVTRHSPCVTSENVVGNGLWLSFHFARKIATRYNCVQQQATAECTTMATLKRQFITDAAGKTSQTLYGFLWAGGRYLGGRGYFIHRNLFSMAPCNLYDSARVVFLPLAFSTRNWLDTAIDSGTQAP
jgi:hypothetical protein